MKRHLAKSSREVVACWWFILAIGGNAFCYKHPFNHISCILRPSSLSLQRPFITSRIIITIAAVLYTHYHTTLTHTIGPSSAHSFILNTPFLSKRLRFAPSSWTHGLASCFEFQALMAKEAQGSFHKLLTIFLSILNHVINNINHENLHPTRHNTNGSHVFNRKARPPPVKNRTASPETRRHHHSHRTAPSTTQIDLCASRSLPPTTPPSPVHLYLLLGPFLGRTPLRPRSHVCSARVRDVLPCADRPLHLLGVWRGGGSRGRVCQSGVVLLAPGMLRVFVVWESECGEGGEGEGVV